MWLAPINAAVALNALSDNSTAYASATQDAPITQTNYGTGPRPATAPAGHPSRPRAAVPRGARPVLTRPARRAARTPRPPPQESPVAPPAQAPAPPSAGGATQGARTAPAEAAGWTFPAGHAARYSRRRGGRHTAGEGQRIRLADGVELLGASEGSGYVDEHHLARTATGRVVQLTDLLFLVAQAGGKDGATEEEVAGGRQRGATARPSLSTTSASWPTSSGRWASSPRPTAPSRRWSSRTRCWR